MEDQQQAEAFCLRVSVLVLNAARWQEMQTLVEQLQEAMAGRAVIEQTKGMLMLRHGWSADEAFAHLRALSRNGNHKLREVAQATATALLAAPPPEGEQASRPSRKSPSELDGVGGGAREHD